MNPPIQSYPSGMPPVMQQPPAPDADLRTPRDHLDRMVSLAGRCWRFRWYAALVLLLGVTASLAMALLSRRHYTSETLIIYREGIGTRTVTGTEANVDAQQKLALKLKELVLSRTTLARLIEEFHLYPVIVEHSGYVDAVDEMRKNIAFRAKDGETFGMSFTGDDPTLVQKMTARLAQELLEEHSKSRLEQAGETREFLDTEKHRSDDDLREKEGMLAGFIAKHPEFAKESNGAGAGTQAGIAIRAMGGKSTKTSDPQLAALEREASRIQERLGMPTRKPKAAEKDIDPKLLGARNDAESDLKSAQRELAEKTAQFTEEHPDVRAAKTRLKAAEGKVRRANEAITAADPEPKTKADPAEEGTIDRAALETELKRVQEEISSYKRRRVTDGSNAAAAAGSASNIVSLETEWTRLNREVTDARERNQQLESRQFKASIMENAVTSARNAQMIIVDPAYKPTHPSKGRTQVVAAGVVVSVVLALMLALLLMLLDDRIYDRIDVEALRVAPLLGVVPRADGKKDNRG